MRAALALWLLPATVRLQGLNSVIDEEAWPEELRAHERRTLARQEASPSALASSLWESFISDLGASGGPRERPLFDHLLAEHRQRLAAMWTASTDDMNEKRPSSSPSSSVDAGIKMNASFTPSAPPTEEPTGSSPSLSPAVEEEEPLPQEETEQPAASDDDAIMASVVADLTDNLAPALFLSGLGLVAVCLLVRCCRASVGGAEADDYARLPQSESDPADRAKHSPGPSHKLNPDNFDAEANGLVLPPLPEKTIIQRPKLSRERSDNSTGAASPVSGLRRGRLTSALGESASSQTSSPRLRRQTSNDVPGNIFEVSATQLV